MQAADASPSTVGPSRIEAPQSVCQGAGTPDYFMQHIPSNLTFQACDEYTNTALNACSKAAADESVEYDIDFRVACLPSGRQDDLGSEPVPLAVLIYQPPPEADDDSLILLEMDVLW
ncbi:hypothetical protein N2152v2_008620 [Parachlorella kessleri]